METKISAAVAEGSEFEALGDWESGPDADLRRKLGFASLLIGGGGALSVRDDSTHFWTKALGFGFAEPVTGDLIGRLVAFYEEQEAPQAVIQLAPTVIPADWDQIRAKAGLPEGSKWVKLGCETQVALEQAAWGLGGLGDGLRVGPVVSAQAAEWAATIAVVFGMPGESDVAMARARGHGPVRRRRDRPRATAPGGADGAHRCPRPGRARRGLPLAGRRDRGRGAGRAQPLAAQPAPRGLGGALRADQLDLAAGRGKRVRRKDRLAGRGSPSTRPARRL